MNVQECPNCKKHDVRYSVIGPVAVHVNTEIILPAYCPDCGCNWDIVYTPDEIREIN